MVTTDFIRLTAICLLLLVVSLILGCGENTDPRLNGTYVLDRDATMAFLETTFEGDKEKLATFEEMLSKPMTITYHGSRQTIEFEGESKTRTYRVAESGPNHRVIECEWSKLDAAIMSEDTEKQRIEFAVDGFWMGSSDIPMEQFKQKYVKQR